MNTRERTISIRVCCSVQNAAFDLASSSIGASHRHADYVLHNRLSAVYHAVFPLKTSLFRESYGPHVLYHLAADAAACLAEMSPL